MSTRRYRKKPVVIDAFQWSGEPADAFEVVRLVISLGPATDFRFNPKDRTITIPTLEGEMRCEPGDYIIRGVKGEYYPCKPDIFKATYEPV